MHVLLPVCNGILRFTSGVTPADLLVDCMAAKSFQFMYLWTSIGGIYYATDLQHETRQALYWLRNAGSALLIQLCTFRQVTRLVTLKSRNQSAHILRMNILHKQEFIPVGCVPSAAVAVCWGYLPEGGVSAQEGTGQGGVCLEVGDVWSGRCVYPGGCLYMEGVCPGGVCPWGGCLPGGVPMDRMAGACENITLPQLHCGR